MRRLINDVRLAEVTAGLHNLTTSFKELRHDIDRIIEKQVEFLEQAPRRKTGKLNMRDPRNKAWLKWRQENGRK